MRTPALDSISRDLRRRRKTHDATESGLKPDEPRIVEGVRGMQSKRFSKRFPNAAAMERWMDTEEASDYEIQYVKKVD